jgi:dipeptidyl aminopeptidase/acylaminoacyl peptidase
MALRLRLDDIAWTSQGELAWLEGRSDRSTIMLQGREGGVRELTPEQSVRASVGYGGGDFAFDHDALLFVERGGTLQRKPLPRGLSKPIFPRFGATASPSPSPDGRWVACVHTIDNQDVLALTDPTGYRWPLDIVRGADFYMQPTWSPDSRRLAWVEWNHPQMPWDGASLVVGLVDGTQNASILSRELVDGGSARPVLQPSWSPDGRHLAWIATDGDDHVLKLRDEATREVRILLRDKALLSPAWVQGTRVYAWKHDSSRLWILSPVRGRGRILEVRLDGSIESIDGDTYSSFAQIAAAPSGNRFAVLASAPGIPDRVAVWDDGEWSVAAHSDPEDLPEDAFPACEDVSWTSSDGEEVHGILYHPRDRRDGLPLLVGVHGGPTSQRGMGFHPDACFYTSRGWAVLEVNYRGSTGYGEAYRRALDGRWGELDVQDCVEGARAMASRGIADPSRMAIKGGSSGGLTVLNALIRHPGVFRAGISNFGVTDLEAIARSTHKFEERYLDRLVGILPDSREVYKARSPVHHAHLIRDHLALFQGTDDRIVPPEQARELVAVLEKNGTPHLLRFYEGEGHGWRKSETIRAHYAEVLAFLEASFCS